MDWFGWEWAVFVVGTELWAVTHSLVEQWAQEVFGFAGLWVATHFHLEQWAQSKG